MGSAPLIKLQSPYLPPAGLSRVCARFQEARQEEIHVGVGFEVARDEDEELEEPAQGEPAAMCAIPSHMSVLVHALVQWPGALPVGSA